jgi:hypothetical protein
MPIYELRVHRLGCGPYEHFTSHFIQTIHTGAHEPITPEAVRPGDV